MPKGLKGSSICEILYPRGSSIICIDTPEGLHILPFQDRQYMPKGPSLSRCPEGAPEGIYCGVCASLTLWVTAKPRIGPADTTQRVCPEGARGTIGFANRQRAYLYMPKGAQRATTSHNVGGGPQGAHRGPTGPLTSTSSMRSEKGNI